MSQMQKFAEYVAAFEEKIRSDDRSGVSPNRADTRAVVVHESACPLEGWDDSVRGKVVWRTLLSADRTPTSQLTLGVTELGPGQPSPFLPHRHTQAEIYYVISGEGVVQIDGVEHALRAGSSVFIPGNVPHGARNTGSDVLRLLYVFAADSFSEVQYVFPGSAENGGPE